MKKILWFILAITLMIPMAARADDADRSMSVTASKSEVFAGEEFTLTIDAENVDAVRLWDGRRDKQLKEFPLSGIGGFTLSITIPAPGTAIYYLTAAYDGAWSEERSARAMVTVKAPQNSGAPNVIPAKSEEEFLGTWQVKYAGIPENNGGYKFAGMNIENDMPYKFSPGYLTVGEIDSTPVTFEDGILFTKQGTFEMTDKGYLSNYQEQGLVAYFEKVSDEYPAEPIIPETGSAEGDQSTAAEPEKYTGRSSTAPHPNTIAANAENEFWGTWEACYIYLPGQAEVLISSKMLGPDAEAYYHISSGSVEYSTPSDNSSSSYSSGFADGKLNYGSYQLSLNDNGMISREVEGISLYFCRIGDSE